MQFLYEIQTMVSLGGFWIALSSEPNSCHIPKGELCVFAKESQLVDIPAWEAVKRVTRPSPENPAMPLNKLYRPLP